MDPFIKRVEGLGLTFKGRSAEGSLDGIPLTMAVQAGRLSATVALRPALDLGMRFEGGALIGDEPDRVATIWGDEGRAFVDDLASDVDFEATDASLEVTYYLARDGEGRSASMRDSDARTIVGYARGAVSVASAVRARAAEAPVAKPLRPFERAAASFASERGLTFLHAPFVIFGNVNDAGILLAAQRMDVGRHVIRARVWPEGKGLEGIAVAPIANMPPDWVEVEGDDVAVGDGGFRSLFRIRATRPDEARNVFGSELCAWLANATEKASVSIRDGMIELAEMGRDPRNPEQFADLGLSMLTAASLVASKPRSAYR